MIFFWGNTNMSWMRYLTLASYRMCNPTHEMILYTYPTMPGMKRWVDKECQDYQDFAGEDYSHRLRDLGIEIRHWDPPRGFTQHAYWKNMQPATMGDFFKWWYLNTVGGIYSDMDILYTRPFVMDTSNIDMGLTFEQYYSIGLLIGKPNAFLVDLIRLAERGFCDESYQVSGVCAIYRVAKTFTDLKDKYPNVNFFNIPADWVYPFSDYRDGISKLPLLYESCTPVPETAIGIHWYAGASISQKYNNLLTDSNRLNNTFCNEVRKLGL